MSMLNGNHKIALIKQIPFKKVKLEYQHCDASKSKENIGIYVGNQNYPKISART